MGNFYEDTIVSMRRLVDSQFNGNVAEASRAWGIKNDNLNKWLKKERIPTLENIAPILPLVCEYNFNKAEAGSIRRVGPNAPIERIEGENLPSIPVMGRTGAGDAIELFNLTPDFWLPVLPQYFRPGMIGLVVDGDSMEPTIHKGAVVGIMPYDGSINEGGIYLVQRPPFGRTIKRIRMGNNNQIVLLSDNPSYQPVIIEPEGFERVISGRVIWIWQGC